MTRFSYMLACLTLFAGAAVCAEPLTVAVSVLPQAALVEQIGGEHVRVKVLVGPGESAETYAPSPRQVAELAKASIYFRVGIPIEDRLLPKLESMSDRLLVVDTRKGVTLRTLEHHAHDGHDSHGHEDEDHGWGCFGSPPKHEDEAAAADPHVWLSPALLVIQAGTIADTLCEQDPAHAGEYRAGLERFTEQAQALHAKIEAKLEPFRGRTIYVFHPAYGYFTDAYGLKQKAVEVQGQNPTPKQIQAVIESARADGVRTIFVQPQFDRRSADQVAASMDGAVIALDPLAKDVLPNIESMAEAITKAFSP